MAKKCGLLLVVFCLSFIMGKKSPYGCLSNIPSLITTSEVVDLIFHTVVTLAGHYMPDRCCCPLFSTLFGLGLLQRNKNIIFIIFSKDLNGWQLVN